jgi:flagellar motility protein MotE (MotC chaperone)
MKLGAVLLILFVLCFGGALAAVLAFNDQLNAELVTQFFEEKEEPAAPEETGDALSRYATVMKEREAAIEQQEAELEEAQKRQGIVQADLEEMRARLDAMLKQNEEAVAAGNGAKNNDTALMPAGEPGIEQTVQTVAAMDDRKAAAALDEMESSEEVAKILLRLPAEQRGDILSRMRDSQKVASILSQLQGGM